MGYKSMICTASARRFRLVTVGGTGGKKGHVQEEKDLFVMHQGVALIDQPLLYKSKSSYKSSYKCTCPHKGGTSARRFRLVLVRRFNAFA